MRRIYALFIALTMIFSSLVNVYAADSGKTLDKSTDILVPQDVVKDRIKNTLVLFVGSSRASLNGVKRLIDKKNPNVTPINKDGRVLVPIRFIGESFGATVSWDADSQTAKIVSGDKTIKIQVGNKLLNVNGKDIQLDVAAIIDNDRVMLPLRAVSEVLGKKVFWFDWGIIQIGDEKTQMLDAVNDRYVINDLIRYLLIDSFNVIEIDTINVDGKLIDGFDKSKKAYSIGLPITASVPKVDGVSSKYKVEVTNAAKITEVANINVIDEETGFSTNYRVQFSIARFTPENKKEPVFGTPSGLDEIKPVKVFASDEQAEAPALNTIDGNLNTRWSAEGEQWIEFDLGVEKEVGAVAAAFYGGDKRVEWFEIQLSQDGQNWETVSKVESGGTSLEKELFTFDSKKASYVKLMCYGNSQSKFNSITEVSIYGK